MPQIPPMVVDRQMIVYSFKFGSVKMLGYLSIPLIRTRWYMLQIPPMVDRQMLVYSFTFASVKMLGSRNRIVL